MDLAYELHDLVRTLDRMADKILRPHGLNFNRYVALVIVSEHPGLTGRDLSGALGVTEAAGSGIVRSLLTHGLIDDAAGAGSGNVRRLRVTNDGAELVRRCSRELGTSLDDSARAIDVDPVGLAATIRALHDEVRTFR